MIGSSTLGVPLQRQEQERLQVSREILALPVTALTTAGVTLYTVPSNTTFQIQSFIVGNYSAASATFSLYVVPSGGSAGNSNIVFPAERVDPGQVISPWDRWQMALPAGSALVMSASANSALNVLLSGMTIYNGDLL